MKYLIWPELPRAERWVAKARESPLAICVGYFGLLSDDATHHYNMDERMKCFIEKYHERGVDETVQAFKALNIFRLTGGRRCEGNFVPGYAMNFYNGRKTQRSIHMVEQYGNWTTGPHISSLSSDERPLVSEFMPKLTIPGEPSPNGSTTGLLGVPMQVSQSVERLAAETVVPIHRKKRRINLKIGVSVRRHVI